MRVKNTGDKLIILIVTITILLFLWAKRGVLQDPINPLLFFSQMFALVGAVLFSMSFIISSRAKFIERLFDGLADAYKTHHLIGAIGFTLLINHPFFLILRAFTNKIFPTLYLLPTGPIPYAYGIISLYTMITLIVLTLFINLKYNVWKFTHTFMGVSLFFAARHIFNIKSDISSNIVLGTWIKFFILSAIVAYLYKLFLYRKISGSNIYKIVKTEKIENVHNITVAPTNSLLIHKLHKPGQYVFVKFLNNKKISNEEHPFSISQSNSNNEITLSIKEGGDFTNKLGDLEVGDTLEIIGPFGLIHEKIKSNKECVFIAGGIGITPFIEPIEELLNNGKKVHLFYSVRNQNDAFFDNKFKNLSLEFNTMNYNLFITDSQERLSVSNIHNGVGDLRNKYFLICGPKGMMSDLSKQLRENGVKSNDIYREDFNLL